MTSRFIHHRKLIALLAATFVLLLVTRFCLCLIPLPTALFTPAISQWKLLDRNGIPLRSTRPDASPFHQRVAYNEIPQSLVQATLAAEDRRFRQHRGVDWRATFRAAGQLVLHHRIVSGASTITQQLIKIAEPRPRTFRTKIIEALQAMRLEQVWDKQRILCEYLNRLEYGNFNTGCSAAAQFYFAKPLGDLSTAECALLAGLPQAPSRLNPIIHRDRACKRQQWILSQMLQARSLTTEEFDRAGHEPLLLPRPHRPFEAPHFVDLLLSSGGSSNPGNLFNSFRCSTIQTTLDLPLTHFVESTVRRHLSHLRSQQAGNAAVVVLENRTGNVLALVGSENYFAPGSGQVNGAWAPRSAGSTFKPFTYLLAFERGAAPATVVADVPTDFATATGLFSPVNYNHHCYGPMRYRLALANSLNVSAVRVLASIGGPEPLRQLLQACGLSTLNRSAEDYGLGLTIGNAEARLLELANAYACLARLGQYRPYQLLLHGARPYRVPPTQEGVGRESISPRVNPESQPVADSGAAYLIADILSDNAARTLAFGAETPLRFEFPVACKTGTRSDFRDNWAFGYTPEFTVGVWVGNFDGAPMQQVSGITGAGPILHDVFDHLHSQFGTTWYPIPKDLVECPIHPLTGHRLAGPPASQPATTEKFLASDLPSLETPDDYAVVRRPNATQPARLQLPIILGPEYRAWSASADNWLAGATVLAEAPASLHITFPLPGTTFYLDPDLPHQGRRLCLQSDGLQTVRWQSDSLRIENEGPRPIALLSEGRHRLLVTDRISGAEARTWIEVLSR